MAKVSIFNLNLASRDALGAAVTQKARFFLRRGHDVRIFLEAPPLDVANEIRDRCVVCTVKDLLDAEERPSLADARAHFRSSNLYIYEFPLWYSLLETMKSVPRGLIVFSYHGVTPPALWAEEPQMARHLQRSENAVSYVHHAHLALANSEFTRADLVERHHYARERCLVLPPTGVSLTEFQPGPKEAWLADQYGLTGKRALLYVGRMAGNKRIDDLVRALPRIRESAPEVVLLLVGDNATPAYRPFVARAQSLAAELGVAGAVIFTGQVPRLAPFYRLCDVFVTASQHEGFGIPVVEAMASGLPVVASRGSALVSTVGDAGLLFAPGDVEELASQVVRVLGDATLRAGLVEAGLRRAREFSAERFEQRLAEIFEGRVPAAGDRPQGAGESHSLAGHRGPSLPMTDSQRPASDVTAPPPNLSALLSALDREADVALRGYTVHSPVPVLGPFIAWVRRNLTSHLWEACLEPIVERQVGFNLRVAESLRALTRRVESDGARGPDDGSVNQEVQALRRRLESLQAEQDELREQLRALRQHLEPERPPE